jgi:hypothetical protein
VSSSDQRAVTGGANLPLTRSRPWHDASLCGIVPLTGVPAHERHPRQGATVSSVDVLATCIRPLLREGGPRMIATEPGGDASSADEAAQSRHVDSTVWTRRF